MKPDAEEMMLDLLTRKAVYGLDEAEERELAELQRKAGLEDEFPSFERTAAAIGLTGPDTSEPMPAALRSRILADAERHFDKVSQTAFAGAAAPDTETSGAAGWFGWLGWAFAAAASLVLAFNIYYTRSADDTAKIKLTADQQRQQLIETAPDLARASWQPGNVKEVVPAGDIVWSDSKQAGYIRLQGLPVNDPARSTYQLWIFDETQDEKTPIDGGTFNVSQTGEVIVPIDPKLAPRNTKMYAITVEKPGGVVVSNREQIVALAKRET